MKRDVRLPTEDDTRRLGEALGATAEAGCALALTGPLGAGKTTLAQGVVRGLGYRGRVTSPTFGLVREYAGRLRAVHLDLYRLGGEGAGAEAAAGDVEWLMEAAEGAELVIVEWPEKAWQVVPEDRLVIALERAGRERLARVEAAGARARAWWSRARRAFEAAGDAGAAAPARPCEPPIGDAHHE